MFLRQLRMIIIGACMLGLGASCMTPQQVMDRALRQGIDNAKRQVTADITDAMVGHLLHDLKPEMMRAYSLGLFQVLFYHGGYYFELGTYEPGDYTRWQASGVEHGEWFEKALLAREEDGSEWWRVESTSEGNDEQESAHLIIEALFSPVQEDGTRYIQKMIALLPGETDAQEIEIKDDEAQSWVLHSDRTLSEQSIEKMTVGTVDIETPAGVFTAEHIRSDQASNSHYLNWWLAEQDVPGKIVKYNQVAVDNGDTTESESEQVYEVFLVKYGSDATGFKLNL